MKKDIHPKYYAQAQITCACGKTWVTGSTKEEIKIELCSNCHPFYTGKQKFLDTARRVEKFKEKSALQTSVSAARKGKKAKKAARVAKKTVAPVAEV